MQLRGEAYVFRLDHNGFQHLQLVIIVKGESADAKKLAALHSKLVEIHIGEPTHHRSETSAFGEESADAKSA